MLLEITGPRQTGKTTLARLTEPARRWVRMDDPVPRARLAALDPVEWDGGTGFVPLRERAGEPPAPAEGLNRVDFDPVDARALRVVFSAPSRFGVAEIEADAPGRQPLELVERKFIRGDDVLVSVVSVRNVGAAPATLATSVSSGLVAGSGGRLTGTTVLHTVPLALDLGPAGGTVGPSGAARTDLVAPGQTTGFTASMAFAGDPIAARAAVDSALADPDPVAGQDQAVLTSLFADLPRFDAPDPLFVATFAHRASLVLCNFFDPRRAPILHFAAIEGRWALKWYTTPIPFGAPHQLREARWLVDPARARGHALNFVATQAPDGALRSLDLLGRKGFAYTDWIGAAIHEVFLVTGDTEMLARARGAMEHNVEHILARDGDGDGLPLVADHFATGREWQPAFFWFSGFDASRPTPLERPDYAAVLYAVSRAAAATGVEAPPGPPGDGGAQRLERAARLPGPTPALLEHLDAAERAAGARRPGRGGAQERVLAHRLAPRLDVVGDELDHEDRPVLGGPAGPVKAEQGRQVHALHAAVADLEAAGGAPRGCGRGPRSTALAEADAASVRASASTAAFSRSGGTSG